jgi:predicted ArsR family transcriptional regulator
MAERARSAAAPAVPSAPALEPAGAAPRERRAATSEETRAMAHPLRLRIIRILYDEALSNQMLATRLGEHPATVLHHVRTLVRTGFIEPAGEQPGARGTVEKLYRTTGKSWQLSFDSDPAVDEVSRAGVAAFIQEVGETDGNADMSRLALVLRPERLETLKRRLAAVLEQFAGDDDPDGERWAVFLAFHRRP